MPFWVKLQIWLLKYISNRKSLHLNVLAYVSKCYLKVEENEPKVHQRYRIIVNASQDSQFCPFSVAAFPCLGPTLWVAKEIQTLIFKIEPSVCLHASYSNRICRSFWDKSLLKGWLSQRSILFTLSSWHNYVAKSNHRLFCIDCFSIITINKKYEYRIQQGYCM